MTDKTDKDALIRKAYTNATQKLREKYPADFNELRMKAAEELGFDWSPRPSKEAKAKAELLRLLEENPSLLDNLADYVR